METSLEALDIFYSNLRNEYLRAPKGKSLDSVFLGLLDLGSMNRRRPLLLKAALPSSSLSHKLRKDFLASGHLQYIEQDTKVSLTTKGIWEVEFASGIIDVNKLLAFIDRKWLDCFTETRKRLSDREKVVLFCALASRAFSRETAVDLTSPNTDNAWAQTINLANEFLLGNDFIRDKEIGALLEKQAALRPVANFFRYSEHLPKATGGLWHATKLKYYLDFQHQNDLSQDTLVFLFGLVFEDKLDLHLAGLVFDFCKKVAYDMSASVFTLGGCSFASATFDDTIERALRKLAIEPS